MQYKTIIFASILLFLFSCELHRNIDLDLPSQNDQLAIIAYLAPNGQSLISLTQSVGIFEDSMPPLPSHASCRIFEGEDLLTELTVLRPDGTFELPANLAIQTGRTYHITASADGFPDILSQDIQIPTTIPIQSSSLVDTTDGQLLIRTTIKDPAHQKNYYILKVDKYIQGQLLDEDVFNAPFIDPALVLSDLAFDGEDHRLITKIFHKAYFMDDYLPIEQLQLILFSLSESTYNYFNSLNKYSSTASDPTLESFPIYSNIEHGYGILGGFSTDTISIQL